MACVIFTTALLCSCAAAVVTQNIPVSTNPAGAVVLADGKTACTTPCSVDLARNQDHLLTFQKAGYNQQDIAVQRQHQTEMALLKAINSGVSSASFFKDTAWGVNSAVQNLAVQQETGEAYALVPATVAIALVPENGFPRKSTEADAEKSLSQISSPLKLMTHTDEHMLENALENTAAGKTTAWTNVETGIGFAVEPQEAKTVSGTVTREFKIGARRDGNSITAFRSAYRVGRGEWAVGSPPATAPKAPAPSKPAAPSDASGWSAEGVVHALAESPWASVSKNWTTGQSSSTKTTHQADGSMTRETSSSSTSVGVSVSPGAVFGILDALDHLADKSKEGESAKP